MNFACNSPSAAHDAAFINATHTFLRLTREYTQSQRQYIAFLYSNYALPSQDPIASYGEENKAILRIVAHKYDPQLVFQRLVPGGFKLYRDGEKF